MIDIKMSDIKLYDSVSIITEYKDGTITNRKGMVGTIHSNFDYFVIGTMNSTYNKFTSGNTVKSQNYIRIYNPGEKKGEITSIGTCRLVLVEKYYKDNFSGYE